MWRASPRCCLAFFTVGESVCFLDVHHDTRPECTLRNHTQKADLGLAQLGLYVYLIVLLLLNRQSDFLAKGRVPLRPLSASQATGLCMPATRSYILKISVGQKLRQPPRGVVRAGPWQPTRTHCFQTNRYTSCEIRRRSVL
jgi:hypothetical protein